MCSTSYSVHGDVQYTVIIGGLLHAYHMYWYHMGYCRVFQMTELRISKVSRNLILNTYVQGTLHSILYMFLCVLIIGIIKLLVAFCLGKVCRKPFAYPSGKPVPYINHLNFAGTFFFRAPQVFKYNCYLYQHVQCICLHPVESRHQCHQLLPIHENSFDESHHCNSLLPWHVQ